ncbi:solute carrier family 22 member 7-like [Penaeus indicus]|uniref:solute carrier family 22 member 7-like n=1 Tax=Penaeus indicus TaxID=29960 RepID=UPI00300D7548
MKDFDDVMTIVGSHGPYQRRVLLGIICPTSVLAAMTMNILLFQVPVPDHWCHVPGQENTSYSHEAWLNLTIPRDIKTGKLSECHQYRVEWTTEQGNQSFIVHNDTHACDFGWKHDTSEFEETLATTNQWFCEERSYSDHVYSINMAGNSVGTIVLPVLADRFIGRRLMFYIALFIHILFTLPAVWVSNYGFHLTLRFFAGLAFETNYMMPYIIGLEFLSPDKRTAATLFSFASWTFGMCLTSLVSWLLPSWQYLALVSCVPSALAFAYWWYLPESPRWLLSQGRIHECATILLNVARINGKKDVYRTQLESDLYILWNLQEKEVSLREATRYPKLRLRALILFFMGACSYLCYGMVFLGITVLSSNYFLSHFVVSISELPSNALGWMWTHFLGRRFTCITTFLITAAFVAAAPFCRHDKWVMLAMVAFIRLFCTQLIYVVYVQCTEIFPTPIRSTGLAWLIVCGLATMISTPFLLHPIPLKHSPEHSLCHTRNNIRTRTHGYISCTPKDSFTQPPITQMTLFPLCVTLTDNDTVIVIHNATGLSQTTTSRRL